MVAAALGLDGRGVQVTGPVPAGLPTPPRWVVVDMAPVDIIDATALERCDPLRAELARDGIVLAVARAR